MELKNKNIVEGMYVTNGKDVWKVLDWNSKYTDCLLQKIDKNGNKMDLFVVAENYELYGDEKEPQIAWMNGDYCIEKRQIDAEQYFVDFYKDNKKFKESKKSLKERSEENEIIVSELQDTVEYFCGLFEDKGELKGRALESLQNAVERLEIFNAIGSIYQWGVEVLNKCGVKYKGMKESKKSFKESKEFFVGDKTAKGFEVCMIEDGKKYYLSKLAKNIVDSDWSSDHTYAKHWKDESKAEEVVNMLNSELKESKKSSRKSLKESAKPINEKNVAKFVDELNKWCDDNVHYKDVDSARFTKEYGKLYDFGYNWDYSYGDKGDLLVFDKEETLDWYDDEVVVPFIKQLAKKYGWYCEPAHSYADFMFAEL